MDLCDPRGGERHRLRCLDEFPLRARRAQQRVALEAARRWPGHRRLSRARQRGRVHALGGSPSERLRRRHGRAPLAESRGDGPLPGIAGGLERHGVHGRRRRNGLRVRTPVAERSRCPSPWEAASYRAGGRVDLEVVVTPGLGDNSYLIASGKEAAVVDPQRDIGRFLAAAEARGVTIRYVLETHVHNDYVSGATEMRAATGAEIAAPAGGGYEF